MSRAEQCRRWQMRGPHSGAHGTATIPSCTRRFRLPGSSHPRQQWVANCGEHDRRRNAERQVSPDLARRPPLSVLRVFVVPIEGNRKPFPFDTSGGNNNGQFSPDGKWVAYQSLESGRRPEIFVRRFPGPGTKSQISVGGGVQVRWRRDGRGLFYLSPDSRLMAVPVRLDAERNTVEAGTPVPLFVARLSGSPQGPVNRQYMASADSQRFSLDAPTEVTLPITVLLNWKPKP